ncbi:pseudouridine synthase [Ferruginibacter sp. SUN002]|uniref:pseudouridine synthase n=1 Tax=Ferruginibacter sp. SUN002 TaxID=2937789 RepID=UPI003D35DB72
MSVTNHRYFILNKPFNMVSQFVSSHDVGLLGDLDFDFPESTHAIGRLDNHSEGLLLLTTNKKVTRLLFLSKVPHKRTYLVQINNIISEEKLHRLRTGVSFKIKDNVMYTTGPCEVSIVENPESLCKMSKRLTAYDPNTWLLITITEGKFHQVRKMIAAIKHKCKRLIRVSIENMTMGNLEPGKIQEIEEEEFFSKLNIVH